MKLLDDLKGRTGYSHLKEEFLDCTMWRSGFGRGFGPVVSLKERTGFSHLKEEALDCTIWRSSFGRGFEPVVRQTTK
jgi:hypothetical protein